MLKYLLVIAVIGAIYFFFIKKKPIKHSAKKDNTKVESNDMIECSICGIYAEVDDSILSNGKYYCSKECLEKN